MKKEGMYGKCGVDEKKKKRWKELKRGSDEERKRINGKVIKINKKDEKKWERIKMGKSEEGGKKEWWI